jgi:hypothetical protein
LDCPQDVVPVQFGISDSGFEVCYRPISQFFFGQSGMMLPYSGAFQALLCKLKICGHSLLNLSFDQTRDNPAQHPAQGIDA